MGECFITSAIEVAVIMNVCRLALGLALPFFIGAWLRAVGSSGLFGMAAFFSLFAAMFRRLTGLEGQCHPSFYDERNYCDQGRRKSPSLGIFSSAI